ncbi:hypothetical protein C8Q77DRAFT_287055 [Trametes polyzona]|nr:hypothetical protein C8Q77DRAFT_287055 [Trametes polyzona]
MVFSVMDLVKVEKSVRRGEKVRSYASYQQLPHIPPAPEAVYVCGGVALASSRQCPQLVGAHLSRNTDGSGRLGTHTSSYHRFFLQEVPRPQSTTNRPRTAGDMILNSSSPGRLDCNLCSQALHSPLTPGNPQRASRARRLRSPRTSSPRGRRGAQQPPTGTRRPNPCAPGAACVSPRQIRPSSIALRVRAKFGSSDGLKRFSGSRGGGLVPTLYRTSLMEEVGRALDGDCARASCVPSPGTSKD